LRNVRDFRISMSADPRHHRSSRTRSTSGA
jgi:hypothetical protein